jgi:hypothetical protein
MPASVPKKVKIGGITLKVLVESDLDSWGEYRSDDCVIALSVRACESEKTMRETLRHEMIHAALDISGLTYSQSYCEEAIVRCLDRLLFPALEKIKI